MSVKSIIGADIKAEQCPTERQDINVVVYVNVIFSLLNNNSGRKKSEKGEVDTSDYVCALADVIKEHPCYHANISVEKDPVKIYVYECYVPCQDLFFNDKGECIDTIGSYSKILYACIDLDNYFKKQVFPIGSKIQVCINAIGFEAIEDIVWGFAFMADACCPNNIEDELLKEWIMDEYEPFFLEYIKKGWKINVTYISLLEFGIVFEVYDKNQLSTNDKYVSDNKNEENAKNKNITFEGKGNAIINKDSYPFSSQGGTDAANIDNNTTDEEHFIKLEGYVSKTEINLSSFFSLDHILDTIPPYNAIRFLDRLTGVDKIEEKINDNAVKSINAYIKGDADKGWMYLKQAGGATLDYFHKRLEVISFAPGLGTVAGLVDGTIYIAQELTAIFGEHDLQKAEELRNKAFWSYLAAIPFTKIIKYGKPVLTSSKAITEGTKRAIAASKKLERAESAYTVANMAKKALTGAVKAVRKPAISNRYAMKMARKDAEWALNNARNDPQYVKALEEYGIKYEDAINGYKVNLGKIVRVLDGKKTPVADFVQTFLFQIRDKNSATSELIRNVIKNNNQGAQ